MVQTYTNGTNIVLNTSAIIVILLLLVFGLVAFIFWIWALVDIIKNPKFKDSSSRILWFVFVLFFHAFGALIYFIFGK